MRHDAPLRIQAIDLRVATRTVTREQGFSAGLADRVDGRQDIFRPHRRVETLQLVLYQAQVPYFDRGGVVDVRRLKALAADQRRQRESSLFLPIQGGEDRRDLSGVTSDRSQAGVGRQTVPLHIIMLGHVP